MPALVRRLAASALVLATVAVFHNGIVPVLAAPPEHAISVLFVDSITNLGVAEFSQQYNLSLVAAPTEEVPIAAFETADVDSAIAEIRRDSRVRAASPVHPKHALANDPLYGEQWWMQNSGQSFFIGAALAIARATGIQQFIDSFTGRPSSDTKWGAALSVAACNGEACTGRGVTVGVIDSGIDDSHPELTGQLSPASRSLVSGYSPTDDENGHGTFIGGLIAARKDNGAGLVGIAPNSTLLPVKVSLAGEYVASTAQAIAHAVEAGAQVVNLSYGAEEIDDVERAIIAMATAPPYNAIVVAAAGNSGTEGNPIIYPAAYPHVISVGAIDSDGQVAAFSEKNNAVDVVAPGVMVFSALSNDVPDVDCTHTIFETINSVIGYLGPYDCLFFDGVHDDALYKISQGTSYSAPIVAGAAALAKQKWPSITGDQFEALVRGTADDDPSGNGPDTSYGAGMLNIQRLVSFNFPPSIDADLIGLTAPVVTNAGTDTTAAVVRVSNMEGSTDLAAVTADFSALGVAQPVTMTPSADMTYESPPQVVPSSVAEGQYEITVTARDAAGGSASATTHLQVLPSGSVIPSLPGGGVNFGGPVGTLDVAVAISTPEKRKIVTRKKAMTLSGTIGGNVAAVEVNGEPADINAAAKTWSARTSLKSGKNRIEVTSFDMTRAASETATLDAVLDRTVPGAVKNLRTEPAGAKTVLRWDAPADKDVAGYHVYSLASGGRKAIATSRKTSATVEGQGPFAVTAEDEAGNEGDVSSMPSAGAATTFTDLPTNHFAAPAVASLLARGIIQPAGRFRPDDAITRAEFAKLLVLARGERGSAPTSFRDVPAGFSLAEYVGAVVRLGWAAGQGDQFYPARPISRIEAARMLVKALGLKPAERPMFTDVEDAAERGVAAAIAHEGIATGQGTLFMPHRTLTRAEAAKMISAILK